MEVRRLEVRNLVHKHMNEMPTMPKGGALAAAKTIWEQRPFILYFRIAESELLASYLSANSIIEDDNRQVRILYFPSFIC